MKISRLINHSIGIACLTCFSTNAVETETQPLSKADVISITDSRFYLEGKPYAELSFNMHDLFWQIWCEAKKGVPLTDDNSVVKAQDADLADLAKMGFKTVRIFGLPWEGFKGDFAAVYNDPIKREKIFYAAVDKTLALCERHGLKVDYSIGVAEFMEAPRGPNPDPNLEHRRELIADPNSRSRKRLYAFLDDFIPRYRSHKAIAMWELGNEITLWADVGSGRVFNGHRMPTFQDVVDFSTDITARIKKHDPLRLVNNGGSYLRESQWNQFQGKGYKIDTLSEQYRCYEMLYAKTPLDVIDIHYYANNRRGYSILSDDGQPLVLDLLGYQKMAAQLKKPLILGEIAVNPIPRKLKNGQPHPVYIQTPDYFESLNEVDAVKRYVQQTVDHIVESKVQLSYWWSYNIFSQNSVDPRTRNMDEWMKRRGEVLAIILDGNKRIKETLLK